MKLKQIIRKYYTTDIGTLNDTSMLIRICCNKVHIAKDFFIHRKHGITPLQYIKLRKTVFNKLDSEDFIWPLSCVLTSVQFLRRFNKRLCAACIERKKKIGERQNTWVHHRVQQNEILWVIDILQANEHKNIFDLYDIVPEALKANEFFEILETVIKEYT